jgi:hypothetical protein
VNSSPYLICSGSAPVVSTKAALDDPYYLLLVPLSDVLFAPKGQRLGGDATQFRLEELGVSRHGVSMSHVLDLRRWRIIVVRGRRADG